MYFGNFERFRLEVPENGFSGVQEFLGRICTLGHQESYSDQTLITDQYQGHETESWVCKHYDVTTQGS